MFGASRGAGSGSGMGSTTAGTADFTKFSVALTAAAAVTVLVLCTRVKELA